MSKKKLITVDLADGLRLGDQIKQFRLASNYSVDEIFVHTRISANFITNLENENWNALPAYAFSRGLLVNLLEFYRLDAFTQEQVITRFAQVVKGDGKTKSGMEVNPRDDVQMGKQISVATQQSDFEDKVSPKISEQSATVKSEDVDNVIIRLPGDSVPLTPEEELNQKFSTGVKLTIVSALLLMLILVLWYFSPLNLSSINTSEGSINNIAKDEKRHFYSLYNGYDTFDLVADDTVKIFYDNQIFNFRLTQVVNTFENQVVANFELDNQRIVKVYLFGESWIDIDKDGNNDVLIKFQKQSGEVAVIFFSLLKTVGAKVNFESIWNNQEKILIEKGEKILLKNQNKIPIQIFIKATTLPVHLAYNIDGQRQNSLNLRPGNNVNLIANEHVELQIGNFRSVILVVNFMPLKLYVERPNQFGITKIVKWLPSVRNETKYDLIVKDFIE